MKFYVSDIEFDFNDDLDDIYSVSSEDQQLIINDNLGVWEADDEDCLLYTSPVKIVNDFTEACKIADDYFNETGYIVAVEETNPVVYPEYEIA